MKTEAAILWGVNQPWSVEEIELDDPHDGEIKVRLAASGLCHSDDHCVKGDLMVGMPIIGGHEGAGVVEAVGPGVSRLKEGDHVVLAFIPSCGYCRWCSSGHQNLCDLGATLMEGTPLDGTFRAHAVGRACARCRCWAPSAPTSCAPSRRQSRSMTICPSISPRWSDAV